MKPLRIGIFAWIYEGDPHRRVFNGRRLALLEESLAHYVQSQGALAYMIPTHGLGASELAAYVADIDGLVLQGGRDVAPSYYRENPLKEEWGGHPERDAYEMALVRACVQANKPVFGICRGLQVINVAFGGSLWQDIKHFHPDALVHRCAERYEANHHRVAIKAQSGLSRCYPGVELAMINSVHHQAVNSLAEGFQIEAVCPDDGVVEAIRLSQRSALDPYCFGVQWHPEFQRPEDEHLLDPQVLLRDFMEAVRVRQNFKLHKD